MTLTLGTLPSGKAGRRTNRHRATPRDSELPKLGLTLAPGSVAGADEQRRRGHRGRPQGGVAAEHGFQVGDVILDVGGKPVSTPADVRKASPTRAPRANTPFCFG